MNLPAKVVKVQQRTQITCIREQVISHVYSVFPYLEDRARAATALREHLKSLVTKALVTENVPAENVRAQLKVVQNKWTIYVLFTT